MMAFVRWRKNRAYLVHNVRQNGKIKQLDLFYFGVNPVIDENIIQKIETKYPAIKFNWNIIEQTIKSPIPKEAANVFQNDIKCFRPLIWAYFEALRKNQIEPGVPEDTPIWDRVNGALPRRRPSYAQKVAHEELWPYFLGEIEKLKNLDNLIKNPKGLAEVARKKFIEAEAQYMKQRTGDRGSEINKNKRKSSRITLDISCAQEILQLPDIGSHLWEETTLTGQRDSLLKQAETEDKKKTIIEAFNIIVNWQRKEIMLRL